MKIEVGYYKTRDGRKARVLCTDAPLNRNTAAGYVEICDKGIEHTAWNPVDGLNISTVGLDLMEPWTEPKKLVPHWPVVLKDGAMFELGFGLYATVEQARIQYATEEGMIRLATELPPIMLEAPE